MAFTCYVRTRDYCTSPKHILDMCLAVIKVSIELGNYVNVSTYVQKAEQTPHVQVPLHHIPRFPCTYVAFRITADDTNIGM